MALIGNKNNRDLFDNLLGPLLPNDLFTENIIYVEPFGGEFGLYEIMNPKPYYVSIYNDIDKESYEKIKEKYGILIYKNRAWKSLDYFNEDYKKIIEMYNDENTFFYCDPPYENKFYYRYNFNEQDHIELSEILKKIKGRFLLSYQDRPLMMDLYKGYNFYKYTGTNFISKPEIAIINY